jgi:hypothetical protein
MSVKDKVKAAVDAFWHGRAMRDAEPFDYAALEARNARELKGYDPEAERRAAAVESYGDGFQPRDDYEREVFEEFRAADDAEIAAQKEAAREEIAAWPSVDPWVDMTEPEADAKARIRAMDPQKLMADLAAAQAPDNPELREPVRTVAEIRGEYQAGRLTYPELVRQEEAREGQVGTQAYWDEIEAAPRLELTGEDADRIDADREAAEEEELYREPRWGDLGEEQRLEYLGDRAADLADARDADAERDVFDDLVRDEVPHEEARQVAETAQFWRSGGQRQPECAEREA